jgi:hypothetical protein
MMPDEYDDSESNPEAYEDLWRMVLHASIEDAVHGSGVTGSIAQRIRETDEARDYIMNPNNDFNEVCSLAGLDPVAVRERVTPMIQRAPSAYDLITRGRRPKPGVVSNFAPSIGTGGGRLLQESSNITFSEKATTA